MLPTLLLGILGLVAPLMAWITSTFLRWGAEARTRTQAAVVAFLLAMMAEMLAGALVYFAQPSASSIATGLWLAGGTMSVTVFPLFLIIASDVRRRASEPPSGPVESSDPRSRSFLVLVIALVLANETLMGIVFSLAAGASPIPGSVTSAGLALGTLVAAVNSPWFLLTMAAEMAATSYFVRDRLPRPVLVVLLLQSAIMAFSPPALGGASWVELSILLSSGLMIGLFVFLMEHLYRHPQLSPTFSTYLVELLAIYALMMAGIVLWILDGIGFAFALAVVLEMAVFLGAVLRPERLGQGLAKPWQLRPGWTFAVLLMVLVSELFMGAALDVQLQPASFAAAFSPLPVTGFDLASLGNALSNGFWFFATVTNSTWFLAMMGAEMGTLVVFKLRESRNLENRIRLSLLLGSYGAFAVFYPSIYFALVAPHAPNASEVPVLGWSMGLGSYPVAPIVFGAILLTYAITGSLAALFGRRVVCSVLCTAPLMYQGTTFDAMKSFNRSSRVGRKYLSSRFKWMYSASTGVTLCALVFVTSASYLDSIGRWNLQILGVEPSVFFFAFSFSVLWYVMFVTIPYTGNYNCVTMGWCYTGAIVQAFQKIGFFKLKVRDREVCRACTTVDCAKGCPIGLVDMPGHFRTKGEFRSSKCCGVGDCVEACPYGNLYVADVRHWIRERLHLPPPPNRRGADRRRPDPRPGVGAPAPGLSVLPSQRLPMLRRASLPERAAMEAAASPGLVPSRAP